MSLMDYIGATLDESYFCVITGDLNDPDWVGNVISSFGKRGDELTIYQSALDPFLCAVHKGKPFMSAICSPVTAGNSLKADIFFHGVTSV